jgi:DNA-binding NtrC family response regulator
MRILWITTQDEPPADWHPLESHCQIIPVQPEAAFSLLKAESVDVIVVNTPLDGWTAAEVLEELRCIDASVPVIVRDPQPTLAEAVGLTKAGAFHILKADAPSNELQAALETAVRCHPAVERPSRGIEADAEPWRQMLIGSSLAMRELVEFVRLVGPRRCTVLISGETGTGKELVARALHMASPRAEMPLVSLNCAALPEQLLEAELFGHVKGAYTGAVASRTGRFEQAHRGTLFLDEIADMPYDLQAKLLRVLQEREFQRLGSSETVRVDVRVIAACNVDLLERVRAGKFREDLYYRLNVVPIQTVPLRERLTDIPALTRHFIGRTAAHEGLPLKQIAPDALDRLCRFDWPGNIRQLENAVETAMVLSGEREVLYASDFRLPNASARRPVMHASSTPFIAVPDHGLDFERTVGQIELSLLAQALQKTNGNKKQAAEMLRLKRTTLAAKLKSLEMIAS